LRSIHRLADVLRPRLRSVVRWLRASRLAESLLEDDAAHPLSGDRCIEWEWVTRHLPDPPARVLDVGFVDSVTAGLAAVRGLDVTGVDLRANPFGIEGLRLIQGSVLDVDFEEQEFDCIVLCSTLEHIGLGGRYGEVELPAGDRQTVTRLGRLLVTQGTIIVTVPVGRSGVYAPHHRIYGDEDIASLFEGFPVLASDYWKKVGRVWRRVPSEVAFDTAGGNDTYALGLLVVGAPSRPPA
jgi:hypothetical protein